jgi:hypothetical protein
MMHLSVLTGFSDTCLERGHSARFPLNACQAVGIVRQGRGQDLDGHVAFQTRVACAIYLSHPARADRREVP